MGVLRYAFMCSQGKGSHTWQNHCCWK